MITNNTEIMSFRPTETRINPVFVTGNTDLAQKVNSLLPTAVVNSTLLGTAEPDNAANVGLLLDEGAKRNPKSTPMVITVSEQRGISDYSDDMVDADLDEAGALRTAVGKDRETPLAIQIALFDRDVEWHRVREHLMQRMAEGQISAGVVPVLVYNLSGKGDIDMPENTLAAILTAAEFIPQSVVNAQGQLAKVGSTSLDNVILPSQWINNRQGIVTATVGCFEAPLAQIRSEIAETKNSLKTALTSEFTVSKWQNHDELLLMMSKIEGLEAIVAEGMTSTLLRNYISQDDAGKKQFLGLVESICQGRTDTDSLDLDISAYPDLRISPETIPHLQKLAGVVKNYESREQDKLKTSVGTKLKNQVGSFGRSDYALSLGMDEVIDLVSQRLARRLDRGDMEQFGKRSPVVVTTDEEIHSQLPRETTNGLALWDTVDGKTMVGIFGTKWNSL